MKSAIFKIFERKASESTIKFHLKYLVRFLNIMYILFNFTTLLFRLNWGRLNVSRLNACSVDVNKNIENLLFGALTNLIAVFSDFKPAKLLEVETDEICQKIFSLNYYLTQFDCKWWVIFPTFFHLVEIYHIKVF